MRYGSLFSGIGGFDLAASWMGWENIFNIEIDPFCRRVLKTHFPFTSQFSDIKKFNGKKYYGTIDIISAGFPCQPFSLAGKRKGTKDDRYLWPETLRVIKEVRPGWIVLENVAGLFSILDPESLSEMEVQAVELFSSDREQTEGSIIIRLQRRIIGTIISEIGAAGYILPQLSDGTPVLLCIPACATGAPHRRDRVWFIAHSDSFRSHDSQVRPGNYSGDGAGSSGAKAASQLEGCSRTATGETSAYSNFEAKQPEANPFRAQCGQTWEQIRNWTGTTGEGGTSSNANSQQRSQGRMHPPGSWASERFISSCGSWDFRNPWQNFPTEPPVCGRDDGVSSGLVDISFSKWRTESIKAFGNAIVPQVAYQLFSAIELIHQQTHNYEPIL